jgi:hypothetical protein
MEYNGNQVNDLSRSFEINRLNGKTCTLIGATGLNSVIFSHIPHIVPVAFACGMTLQLGIS